ncbi:NAD-dependent epimerase/dehydratase family protein [Parvularcula lutaonensis]|uniref:NAD-dependent epimerase/dehydratase family protein n=1 Tax=Parvularcula lutaonensis TaxID=491923 RepID=A0ABV7M8K7_9PROT|nr:NAD(P)-dependent oxidoreductase [Parvularcula lutaonensis]GGY44495.1 hypothetical protein GCM10007148_11760 [Parvularcula lutaonensis]
MNKVLLLSGAGGFLGKAVQRAASARPDIALRPVSRLEPEAADWPEAGAAARAAFLHLGWPSLGHFSAQGSGTEDPEEWQSFRHLTGELAHRCASAGIPFFQVGSGVERYAGEGGPLGEPYATYARRKAEIWDLVRGICAERSARLRVHFVFGPEEAAGRLIPAAIKAAQAGEPFPMGALERRRHWAHVDDVAAGLLDAVFAQSPENWDICGPETVSFTDIVRLVSEAVGEPLEPVLPAKPPADATCPVIAAENPAPFLHGDMGGLTDLGRKLQHYAEQLLRSR